MGFDAQASLDSSKSSTQIPYSLDKCLNPFSVENNQVTSLNQEIGLSSLSTHVIRKRYCLDRGYLYLPLPLPGVVVLATQCSPLRQDKSVLCSPMPTFYIDFQQVAQSMAIDFVITPNTTREVNNRYFFMARNTLLFDLSLLPPHSNLYPEPCFYGYLS